MPYSMIMRLAMSVAFCKIILRAGGNLVEHYFFGYPSTEENIDAAQKLLLGHEIAILFRKRHRESPRLQTLAG